MKSLNHIKVFLNIIVMPVKATAFIIVLYFMSFKDLKQLCDLAGMTLELLM